MAKWGVVALDATPQHPQRCFGFFGFEGTSWSECWFLHTWSYMYIHIHIVVNAFVVEFLCFWNVSTHQGVIWIHVLVRRSLCASSKGFVPDTVDTRILATATIAAGPQRISKNRTMQSICRPVGHLVLLEIRGCFFSCSEKHECLVSFVVNSESGRYWCRTQDDRRRWNGAPPPEIPCSGHLKIKHSKKIPWNYLRNPLKDQKVCSRHGRSCPLLFQRCCMVCFLAENLQLCRPLSVALMQGPIQIWVLGGAENGLGLKNLPHMLFVWRTTVRCYLWLAAWSFFPWIWLMSHLFFVCFYVPHWRSCLGSGLNAAILMCSVEGGWGSPNKFFFCWKNID